MSLFDRLIGASMPLVPKPIVRRIAARYIAGESLDDQLATIGELNEQGFMVATSILGEFVTRREESEEAVAQYEEVLVAIAIISVGVLAISSNTTSVTQNSRRSANFTTAVNLAQEKMEELKAQTAFTNGTTNDNPSDPHPTCNGPECEL